MFEYINGKVSATGNGIVVIDINGVGIKLLTTLSLSQRLREGSIAKLFTIISLKNEEMKLYGFSSSEERDLFIKFQSVSGIGPAIALNILSSASLETLYQGILDENVSIFKSIKGIGPKTAKRIILELKGSLAKQGLSGSRFGMSDMRVDAAAALMALGYTQEDSWNAVNKVLQSLTSPSSLDELIRKGLGELQANL